MATEYEMKTSDAAGPVGTESPVNSPATVPLLFDRVAFMATPRSTSWDWELPTSVYLIRSGDFHKVGIAEDVERRRAALQLANPGQVVIERSFRYRSRLQALLVERTVHQVLAPWNVHSEWFSADRATIDEAISLVRRAMGHLMVIHEKQRDRARQSD